MMQIFLDKINSMDDDDDTVSTTSPLFPQVPTINNSAEFDWSYSMRRQMQEIIPGLFLGPYAVATKKMLSYLQNSNISHIVCVRHPLEARTIKPNFPEIMSYLVIDMAENTGDSIIPYLSKVKQFIDNCLQCQGCVLVHGNAGISISPTFVIGYVMETYGLSFNDAFILVQRKRFCVNPSEILKRQLLDYEAIHLAKHQASRDHTGPKRPHYEMEDDNSEFPHKALKL